MSVRRAWIVCLLAGLVVLAMAAGFGSLPGFERCTAPDPPGPIIAFEMVTSPQDVAAIFGEGEDRAACAEAMRTSLLIDAFVFIPAYAIFLIFALIALRERGTRIAVAGIAAVTGAALLDEIEGIALFAILAELPGGMEEIGWLIPAVRGKFALLALAAMAIGWLLSRSGRITRVAGLVVTAGGALTIVGLAGGDWARLLTLGATISWVCLLLIALAASWRRPQKPR